MKMSNAASDEDNAVEDDGDCTNCIWTRVETVSQVSAFDKLFAPCKTQRS
jgi:hypothetical protein